MFRAFKYRIYPTKEQTILIHKHIGCSRYVYNLALETKTYAYKEFNHSYSANKLITQLPDLKRELAWLKEVNSQTLQASIRNLDDAFIGFFKHGKGFPKFKSRNNDVKSFHIPQNIEIKDNRVFVPKFLKKGIKVVLHRNYEGKIKNATISEHCGKYFISLTCEVDDVLEPKPIKNRTDITGIDVGLKDFIVTSNGIKISAPKYYRKEESKLKYIQRKYSKYKGKRTKKKLALQHQKVANLRKDFLHKVSHQLVSENHALAIENLNVKGMMKNRKLSKSIGDAGWGMFRQMLTYKSEFSSKHLLVIGRFEPSSKTCNCCGHKNSELELKDRHWICSGCGSNNDRDKNASLNIRDFAWRDYSGEELGYKNNNVSGTDTKKAEGVACKRPYTKRKVGSRSVDSRSVNASYVSPSLEGNIKPSNLLDA